MNYLVNNCNSFINRTSNAQFSQVFSSNVLNSLTNAENSIFQTTYFVKGYCDTCHCDINANSCVTVNYFSDFDLDNCEDLHNWSDLMCPTLHNKTIQCGLCEEPSNALIETYNASKIYFLELSPLGSSILKFPTEINIEGNRYLLQGLVRHNSAHFTCAVLNNGKWIYIDDMRQNILTLDQLDELYERYQGWFFGIYVLAGVE